MQFIYLRHLLDILHMKKIAITTLVIVSLLVAAELILRVSGGHPAHWEDKLDVIKITPGEFFKIDKVLGWKVCPGHYFFTFGNEPPFFECRMSADNERFTPGDTSTLSGRKKIFLYGGSSILGFYLSDTEHLGYCLQQILPQYKVKNKAGFDYSMIQRYLALKKSVSEGDTPSVAILNYRPLNDWFSPYGYNACRIFRYEMDQAHFTGYTYPYISSDTVAYLAYSDFPKDWPLRNRSVLVDCLNTYYDKNHDDKVIPLLHHNSIIALKLFSDYCLRHKIKLILSGIDPNTEKELAALPGINAEMVDYPVNLADTAYNCQTKYKEPHIPNGRANKLFAEKLAAYIQKGKK